MYWLVREQAHRDDRNQTLDAVRYSAKSSPLLLRTRQHRYQRHRCTIHRVQRIDQRRTRIVNEPIDQRDWKYPTFSVRRGEALRSHNRLLPGSHPTIPLRRMENWCSPLKVDHGSPLHLLEDTTSSIHHRLKSIQSHHPMLLPYKSNDGRKVVQ